MEEGDEENLEPFMDIVTFQCQKLQGVDCISKLQLILLGDEIAGDDPRKLQVSLL